MSILIIYLSKHGTVEEVAKTMKQLSGEVVEIKKLDTHINGTVIEKYDSLIVGGSIHMGKAQKRLVRFCKTYSHFFKEKKSGIFLCSMTEPKNAAHYLEESFPKEILNACHTTGLFGGSVKFEKMNFIERTMMKKITRKEDSFSQIDSDRIAAFIESF